MESSPDYHESDPRFGETQLAREERHRREAFETWCKRSYNPVDGLPPFVGDAMLSVADTLHGAWLLARQEFGDDTRPEHAVMLLSAIEAERARIESGWQLRIQEARDE